MDENTEAETKQKINEKMANDSTFESFAIRIFHNEWRNSPAADIVLSSCFAIHIHVMSRALLITQLVYLGRQAFYL